MARGVARRGSSVPWPSGIVPYESAPGYGLNHNFAKYNSSEVDIQSTSYDYGSVMHYESTAFPSNGLPTIVPIQPNTTIGQRDNLSSIEIQEVRLFYNCTASGLTLPTIITTTTGD
ncbi:unnamed protein product [Rotaria sp. Silwood2]|nr:unnamed protein product [Rotaria sp. Silwood2]